jgi:hypothetical protein
MFNNGAKISDPKLPVDIEVLQYMPNSRMFRRPTNKNLATAGFGLEEWAEETPVVSGVNTDDEMDMPSAYVRLRDRATNADLGVWLVSHFFQSKLQPVPQKVDAGGKSYQMAFWNKRTYKPYSIYLQKFTHDKYIGTETPKDYRSHIRLVDSELSTDRETEIYMNNPMRYRGETFYQSGVLKPQFLGKKGTILQVVHNPSWQLPYLACTLVSGGMLVHFGMYLYEFLKKRRSKA